MALQSDIGETSASRSGQSFVPHFHVLVIGIVLGNLVPIVGVLFWGWELFEIFYLYWIENVVIGIFVWLRMLALGVRSGVVGFLSALFMCAFFTVHYGMFCMGHGMIMTEIFYADQLGFTLTELNLFLLPWLTGMEGFVYALAGIIFVEILYNLSALRKDIEKSRSVNVVMFAPYGRIVILHLTILLGGGLSLWLGFPPAALIFLVVLKIAYDLGMMRFIHDAKEEGSTA